MHENELRFRQVHLDYHTSEHIEGIGADFDPDEFGDTLVKAAVDSITVFGRGHHGWTYYESKKFPERVHPHLANKNLLAQQIEACHKRNIRAPIYLTVQWDNYSYREQPDWMVIDPTGKLNGTEPYHPGFYNDMCVNTPYREFLRKHVAEVFDMFPVDGLFFDIVSPDDCSCKYCVAGMRKKGLDPSCENDRWVWGRHMINDWKREMSAFVRSFDKDATIFYNAGHVGPHTRPSAKAYSHWELESLPSGGWGYMHFPTTQRFARNLGLESLGMTGKFHTSWGDFHSFKNPAALQFECFQMLALNAKCSVGDQLPPDGRICPDTYELIGSVYREVAKKEAWCSKAEALVDIAVFTPEEFAFNTGHPAVPGAAMGATRMLQEEGHQFDFIDGESSLSKYKVLILPDAITVSEALSAKLEKFVADGGKLIASYCSGLNDAGDAFALDCLGVDYVGPAPFSPDFLVPTGQMGKGLPATEHAMYKPGLRVRPRKGSKTLTHANVPYFNRTWDHFCSHRHTPSAHKRGYPGVVASDGCIYFMHPVFAQYADNAALWAKKLLLNALAILLPDPLVTHDGPTTVVTALNKQKAEKRLVLHLLHYIPERRGGAFDVIEDIIPLHDLALSVRNGKKVKSVTCVPDGEALAFVEKDGRVEFTLPKLVGHQMIELAL